MEDGKQSSESGPLIDVNKLTPICNQEGIILKSLLKSMFEIALFLNFHHLLSKKLIMSSNFFLSKNSKTYIINNRRKQILHKAILLNIYLLFLS